MLLRPISHAPRGGIYPRFLRQFHDTPRFRDSDDGKNYYEILGVKRDASMVEIKKSFYNLSKTHHPDLNPSDPDRASKKFVKISQAYTTLSNPSLRSSYDASTFTTPHPQHHHHHPQGSYFSGSPAGGRPASGLSRRRTQFRGPPPSFYRSGGWGTQFEKREEHSPKSHQSMNKEGEDQNDGGWVFESRNQTWNRKEHLDTHTAVEKRRKERERIKQMIEEEEALRRDGKEMSQVALFLWISAGLGFMGWVASLKV